MKNFVLMLFSFVLIVALGCNNVERQSADPPVNKVEYVYADLQVSDNAVQAPVVLVQESGEAVEDVGSVSGEDSAGLWALLKGNEGYIFAILWLLSEILASSKLKSNSIFQLIFGWIKGKATFPKKE